jgi:antitoxin component HigA of HigAB toxin-antitoxin module
MFGNTKYFSESFNNSTFYTTIFAKINFYVYFCSMKTNRVIDGIRKDISSECKEQVELSVAIANRIYEILEIKGMNQKDLAQRLGKTETEVSRWLSGTHNLTLSTICKISTALGEDIVTVPQS